VAVREGDAVIPRGLVAQQRHRQRPLDEQEGESDEHGQKRVAVDREGEHDPDRGE
jgi:hypothetical protein